MLSERCLTALTTSGMPPPAFGVGSPTEIAIIAGVVVLLFGGAKFVEFGRSAGRGIQEVKKAIREQLEAPPAPPAPKETFPVNSVE